jgi:hypothetical protein
MSKMSAELRNQASIKNLVSIAERRLAVWNELSRISHSQIGPLTLTADKTETQKADSHSIKVLVQDMPPGAEYAQDGAQTTVIMASALFERLFNQPDEQLYRLPFSAFQDLLNRNQIALEQAREQVFSYVARSDMIFPRKQVRRAGPCTELEAWLLRRSLKLPGDMLDTLSHAAPARAGLPCMVFYELRDTHTLERIKGYWLEDGLLALLFDNSARKGDHWEEARLQLTLEAPFLLVCDGVLRGSACAKALADVVGAPASNKPKPVVIILAEDVDRAMVFDDSFYTIVLPTPASVPLPQRRSPISLDDMAQAFGTSVVRLPKDQGELSLAKWRAAARNIGRCRVAQIDRQRALLVPQKPLAARSEPFRRWVDGPAPNRSRFSRGAWAIRALDALILPRPDASNAIPPISKAEALLRARMDAEDGVMAGAGAGLYWLAEQIDAPQDSLAWWLKEALRAPMLQVLRNSGVTRDTHQQLFDDLTRWVIGGDRPWRTFLIERHTGAGTHSLAEGHEDMVHRIDDDSVLIRGDLVELGVFTPVAQIKRMVDRAFQIAWHVASLNYLKHLQ